MTYQLNPRLFVENGAALAAQRVHRRHDTLRIIFAEKKTAEAANDQCTIRFAI
jgi:hypothetical protein